MSDIPYEVIGIPVDHQEQVRPTSPAKVRLAVAKGLLPIPPDILIAMMYVLLNDPKKAIRQAASESLKGMPEDTVISAMSRRTHPKVLEFFALHRATTDPALMERIYSNPAANDRTCVLIAASARGDLVDIVARNQERMLMTPQVFLALKGNEEATPIQLERMESFLRMQRSLPDEEQFALEVESTLAPRDPEQSTTRQVHPSVAAWRQADAEVLCALAGLPSPTSNPQLQKRIRTQLKSDEVYLSWDEVFDASNVEYGEDDYVEVEDWEGDGEYDGEVDEEVAGDLGFAFNFEQDADMFSAEMMDDEQRLSKEEVSNLQRKIADMTIGQRIKLAYLGNGEARKLLLRDQNKSVAVAVVKSGRMSDSEAASAAANRNLHGDVLREICNNKEFLRAYKVKVALVNNPKTPVSVAVNMVSSLHKSDLASVARNKNVSSVINRMANKIVKGKPTD